MLHILNYKSKQQEEIPIESLKILSAQVLLPNIDNFMIGQLSQKLSNKKIIWLLCCYKGVVMSTPILKLASFR
jgi:hypothetical protein